MGSFQNITNNQIKDPLEAGPIELECESEGFDQHLVTQTNSRYFSCTWLIYESCMEGEAQICDDKQNTKQSLKPPEFSTFTVGKNYASEFSFFINKVAVN